MSTEPPPREEVRRIGCLMLNGVGDIVCVTPALAALRDRYPDARISAMVRPHLRGLLEGDPAVDDIVAFGQGSLGKRLAFLREMRRRRFDLWVDLHTPTFNTMTSNRRTFLRNAALMRWSGARYRRAYAVPQLARHLTHPIALPEAARLRRTNVVALTVELGWPDPGRSYPKRLPVGAADRAWAAAMLPPGRRRVALYFGTRQPAKLWPATHAAELVALVLARWPDAELVIVGDESDAAFASSLRDGLGEPERGRIRDFAGAASFPRTAALLERCDAMVSSDSGAMHIGDAMGVPIVALFSSHNYPGVWSPVNGRSVVIHHEIECGPCFLAACPVGNRCMRNITPQEAFDALYRRLGD